MWQISLCKIFHRKYLTQRIYDAVTNRTHAWVREKVLCLWIPRLPGRMGCGTWRNTNLLGRERKQSRQNEICRVAVEKSGTVIGELTKESFMCLLTVFEVRRGNKVYGDRKATVFSWSKAGWIRDTCFSYHRIIIIAFNFTSAKIFRCRQIFVRLIFVGSADPRKFITHVNFCIYNYTYTYTNNATKCITLLRIRSQGNWSLPVSGFLESFQDGQTTP